MSKHLPIASLIELGSASTGAVNPSCQAVVVEPDQR
jgi:hypothetical protein